MTNKVKKYRNNLNLTQEELASMADISRPYLSEIENDNVNPTLRTAGKIAMALKTTVDDLFGEITKVKT